MPVEVPMVGPLVEGTVRAVGGAMPELNRTLYGGYSLRFGCRGAIGSK